MHILIKLKSRKKDSAVFEVLTILNAQGYMVGESPKRVFGNEAVILVDNFFREKKYEELFEIIEKKEIVETNVSITDSNQFSPNNRYKIDVNEYGIKRINHLYNCKWITNTKNLFYEPEKRIINLLKQNKSIIPVDLESKKMFEAISLIDGVIQPSDLDSNELKSFDITVDDRFIPVAKSKDEYYITEKAYKKLTNTQSVPVDLMGKNGLKKWLRELLLSSNKNESKIDALLNDLHYNTIIDDKIVQNRLKRCRMLFKETVLSKEDLQSFLDQPDWKKAIDDVKQNTLNLAREEAKAEVILERDKMMAQIDEELKHYRDSSISARIEEQEAQLEELQNKVKTSEQLLSSIEQTIDSKKTELEIVNSEIQTRSLSLNSLTENKVKIIEELEESKRSILANLRENLSNTNAVKETHNSFEEYFPDDPTSIDLDEDEDEYKIISTNWSVDLKRDIVSPLKSIASMIPNISYAYTLAHFAGSCHVKVITVEHGWYHFEDFINAGLLDFWNDALSSPDENYILVLQNINMIPILSALQPLVDIIAGIRISLPGAKMNEFPKNLRILGTILPTEGENALGLSLDEKSYGNFHFIGSPEDTLVFNLPKILSIIPKRHIKFSDFVLDEGKGKCTDGFERYSAY